MKSTLLNDMAREFVGDGNSPNLFFVSENGNVLMVTTDFEVAHAAWLAIPRSIESALEDRENGVLASTEPAEDGSKRLRTYDDSRNMLG